MIPLRHRRTAWLFALAVRSAIEDALSQLKDAETGQRGFLLTDDPAFLSPYQSARLSIDQQLARLIEVTHDDEEAAQSARRIRTLAGTKLDELNLTLTLAQHGRFDAALAIVRKGEGRRVMVEIRAEVARMLSREQVALETREQKAARGQRETEIALECDGVGVEVARTLRPRATSRARVPDGARRREDVPGETRERPRAVGVAAGEPARPGPVEVAHLRRAC